MHDINFTELPISLFFILFLFVAAFLVIKIVPHQQAWIVERFGKFHTVFQPGLNFIIPIVDRVAYKHTLKEQAVDVHAQTAISKDNVTLSIDGVLYVKILDPVAASYGVDNPYYAITQLAQTTMRSEIGKLKLDKTFEEREALNINIVQAINHAANSWGISCMRYEIKDIKPPKTVLDSMELQVAAERQKRATILESEGQRQSKINIAEGDKQERVLASEARKIEQINIAEGKAGAILKVAEADAKTIKYISEAINKNGESAVSLKIAEKYVSAFEKLAKENNTLLLPADVSNPGGFVAGAISIFEKIQESKKQNNKSSSSSYKSKTEKHSVDKNNIDEIW